MARREGRSSVVWLATRRARAWPGGPGCGGGVDPRLSGVPQVRGSAYPRTV
jgi:hypothetical protein